jgi:tetratricopeptide (TPR) repeat protein
MNTELIGFENGYDIKKMLDNDPETYFYSRPLSGNEVITIAFKDKTTFELKMINGYARSLSAYKSKARIYKIRAVTEEGIERDITLSDYILEPQSLGLFDTRTLKLYIKAVYKAGNDTSFAISEIIIRPVGDADYARYQQLLSRRKGITKILSLADKYIRGKHYFKALEKLDKALDEIPESLKASDLGISIRTCVLRIYLEKLKDYAKAVKIAEDLFDISVAEENREVFDLTKTPYNNSLGIDIRGLNTYFIELKYRKKTDYTLFVIRLKSRINYLGALAYFKLQDVSKSLSLLKEIVLKYGGYSYSRGLKNKNYYKKNALDFIYKNIPADVAYSYIKNNMLEEYSALNKKDGDYNYFYYILGKLAEKNADKNYALLMYKKCLEITESFAQTQKPLSFILASKRIREISVN